MKRHLFKVILGGFIVFLTLPVIFDTDGQEAVVKPSALNSSADVDGGSEVMLPVVQKALPFRSENVLSKYAGRFKRFYVNSKEEKQKISQEIQQEQNGLVYASSDSFSGVRSSYGRAASAEDEAYVKEYFTDVEAKDAPANYGAIAATAGTKQKIHDNAPVKGLYESSAVDSYEARIKAKEVYSNVMSRVDTATSPKVAVEEEEAVAAVPAAKRAVYASAADAQDGKGSSGGTGNKYIGIASKGSSRPSSASGGSLSGGFGRGGVSAKEADASSGGISMGNFEVAAQNVEGKVEKVAPEGGISKSFTVVSNGKGSVQKPSSPANPNQPQKPGTQPNNPNNPGNPSNPNNPGNPNNPSGDDPQQPKPDTFDPSKWIAKYTAPTVCEKDPAGVDLGDKLDTSTTGNAFTLGFKKIDVGGDEKELSGIQKEASGGKKVAEAGWSPACVEESLPKMPQEIADSHKFLIIAGSKNGKYVALGSDSFEGSLLTDIQKAKYADIPVKRAEDGFYYIPEHLLTHKILQEKNIIPIVPSGEGINGVAVEPGSLKKDRTAYDKMVGDIEKYSKEHKEAAAEAAKKAADDAEAAKKAEQEKIDKNKKEVVDQTKEAVEKANGK